MKKCIIEKLDFDKVNGLIPAIIQDINTGTVLMLGYMNKIALETTCETGKVTFFSRTRQVLWVKGEESGNYLDVIDISVDCDNDTLLILVSPKGSCCHTGQLTCFRRDSSNDRWAVFSTIESIIQSRHLDADPNSYTFKILQQGLNKIAQKVGEEGVEVVVSALNESDERLLCEISDLIFHLLILLHVKNLSISDVYLVLLSRLKE